MKERVQKIIAASGFCSRRKAEELISLKKVSVNGKIIHLGDKADVEKDEILIGKQLIKKNNHLTLMLHKPSNYLCTKKDLFDRRTIMELVSDVNRSIYPVGRLDRDARGLILMTSDGELAQKILHPSNKISKTYQVGLERPLSKQDIHKLVTGVIVDKRKVFSKIKKIKPKLIEITIFEGRNKIVKRIFNEIEHRVKDLKRVAIGNLRLSVAEGEHKKLTEKDIEKIFSTNKTESKKEQKQINKKIDHQKNYQKKENNNKKYKNKQSNKKNNFRRKN